MANYRKTYLCICDGQQETMYLNQIAETYKRSNCRKALKLRVSFFMLKNNGGDKYDTNYYVCEFLAYYHQ